MTNEEHALFWHGLTPHMDNPASLVNYVTQLTTDIDSLLHGLNEGLQNDKRDYTLVVQGITTCLTFLELGNYPIKELGNDKDPVSTKDRPMHLCSRPVFAYRYDQYPARYGKALLTLAHTLLTEVLNHALNQDDMRFVHSTVRAHNYFRAAYNEYTGILDHVERETLDDLYEAEADARAARDAAEYLKLVAEGKTPPPWVTPPEGVLSAEGEAQA